MQKFKILRQPFLEEQWGRRKEKKKEKKSMIIVVPSCLQRRRWRTHTLGPMWKCLVWSGSCWMWRLKGQRPKADRFDQYDVYVEIEKQGLVYKVRKGRDVIMDLGSFFVLLMLILLATRRNLQYYFGLYLSWGYESKSHSVNILLKKCALTITNLK